MKTSFSFVPQLPATKNIIKIYRIKNLEQSKVLLLMATLGSEGKGRQLVAGKQLEGSAVKLISCHGQQIRTVRPSKNRNGSLNMDLVKQLENEKTIQ